MKKLIMVSMLLVTIFLGGQSVKAVESSAPESTNTLEQVVTQMKSQVDSSINVTSTENSMTVSYQSVSTVFNYENGIISYNFTGSKTDISSFEQIIFDGMCIQYLIQAVGTLNGYTENQIIAWFNQTDDLNSLTLQDDGVELVIFDYIVNQEPLSIDVDGIESFKIDINNFNIPEMAEVLIPTISLKDITANSLTVRIEAVSDVDNMCDIYRATDTSDYEAIAKVNCGLGGEVEYTDGNLQPNTTYYYKVAVSETTNYSKTVVGTTKSAEAAAEVTKDIANPETADMNIVLIVLVIISAVVIALSAHQKNDTKKL